MLQEHSCQRSWFKKKNKPKTNHQKVVLKKESFSFNKAQELIVLLTEAVFETNCLTSANGYLIFFPAGDGESNFRAV